VNFEEMGQAIARPPFRVEGGHITLPTAPGLGIDLDEGALALHPHRETPLRRLRRPEDE
jgi:L-alanine-DL-glutamate epimerase-like enolase superfamily enzyme